MKLFKCVLTTAGALLLAGTARAANPADVEVWVMLQNLSVTIASATSYDYNTVSTATSTAQTVGFQVTNSGNVAEKYQLRVLPASTALLGGGGAWTLVSAAPAADQCRLSALFNSVAPAVGAFDMTQDPLTLVAVTSGAIDPAPFIGDQNGNGVAAAANRNLWTRFDAPTSTAQFGKVNLKIEITAIP